MTSRQNISQFISAELINTNHANIGMPPEVVLENLLDTLQEKEVIMGQFISKGLEKVKRVGDALLRCDYLLIFENMEIDFSFLYIKANNRWQVHNFYLRQGEESLLSVA
ncbi:MAG: hypothetical protein AAF502_01905 [Bacteroidota bacterium]